jgi:hypothetical protein
MAADDDAGVGPSEETIARLRFRAEQLRATREVRQAAEDAQAEQDAREAETPVEPDAAVVEDDVDDDELFHGATVDPETEARLDRWADEISDESVAPRRNWSPLIAVVVVAAIIGLGYLGARTLIDRSGDTGTTGTAGRDDGSDGASVLDADTPTLDELTSDVTLPPGPDEGLQVAAQGITIVPDRFDSNRREGTFAVIVANPHEGWLAQGVQVSVTFLDEGGSPLGSDSGFVEVVLPAQRVAVASLFFDAPTVPVASLDIAIDVARWRETGPFAGGFTVTDVQTGEAEFSGVRTTFEIRSDFDEPLVDVGVTAVYRAADGRIIGGYDTFVELLEPGVPTPAMVDLLANIDPADIASTELYPTAAFGSVPEGRDDPDD